MRCSCPCGWRGGVGSGRGWTARHRQLCGGRGVDAAQGSDRRVARWADGGECAGGGVQRRAARQRRTSRRNDAGWGGVRGGAAGCGTRGDAGSACSRRVLAARRRELRSRLRSMGLGGSTCFGRIRWHNVIADIGGVRDVWVMRTIAVLAYPGVQILDVTGPLEVFARAGEVAVERGSARISPYRVEVLAPAAGPLRSGSGVGLVADRAFTDVAGGIDTLLVAGGREGTRAMMETPAALGWLRQWRRACGGSARCARGRSSWRRPGSLDGRRVTTHWAACDALREDVPEASASIPIRSACATATSTSSAGVTAGMDLALALVEEDLGRDVALEIARAARALPAPPGRTVAVQRAARGAGGRPRAAARAVQPGSSTIRTRTLAVERSPSASR